MSITSNYYKVITTSLLPLIVTYYFLILTSLRKDIASFQIANGGERRHVMCVGARSGTNPGPLGSETSALTNCASCPLLTSLLFNYYLGPSHYCIITTYLLRLHYYVITTSLLRHYCQITTIDCLIITCFILRFIAS